MTKLLLKGCALPIHPSEGFMHLHRASMEFASHMGLRFVIHTFKNHRNPSAFQSSLKKSSYFWVTDGLDSSGKQNRCDGSVYWTAAITKHHFLVIWQDLVQWGAEIPQRCSEDTFLHLTYKNMIWWALWPKTWRKKKKKERVREPVKLIICVTENA